MDVKRTRILCFGNRLFGDDGFGPLVHDALAARPLPAQVELIDAGIAGANAAVLFEDCEQALVVDALRGACLPGQVRRLRAEELDLSDEASASSHGLGIAHLLRTLPLALGGAVPDVVIFGTEVSSFDLGTPAGPAVVGAVPETVARILIEIAAPRYLPGPDGGGER